MSPSINARWSERGRSFDFVAFRAVPTTLYSRARNARTIPAPMPCDAPVTITVLGELFISLKCSYASLRDGMVLIAAATANTDGTYYFALALQRNAVSENHDLVRVLVISSFLFSEQRSAGHHAIVKDDVCCLRIPKR